MALTGARLVLGTSLATAARMTGTVSRIDDTGRATVTREEGNAHPGKGEGWQPGATVACETKAGKTRWKATISFGGLVQAMCQRCGAPWEQESSVAHGRKQDMGVSQVIDFI